MDFRNGAVNRLLVRMALAVAYYRYTAGSLVSPCNVFIDISGKWAKNDLSNATEALSENVSYENIFQYQ